MRGRAGVEVRIAINTGEVVMRTVQTGGHIEYTPVGHAINLAARMQTAAPANGIIISDDTRRLVEGYFELRALGQSGESFYEAELFRLKGELLQSSNADAASIKACLYKSDRSGTVAERKIIGAMRDSEPRAVAREAGPSR
jgi:adenylate/guanylate cyclase family protein